MDSQTTLGIVNTTTECINNTNASIITIQNTSVKCGFYILYLTIFTLGLIGNALVCHVVCRNKAMQTVTNIFIMNLALSDILLCILAIPFTPLYSFMGRWIFGRLICHLVPYAQGASIYISTLTLTAIAIDRYFVIIYPLRPRMKLSTCIGIIVGIWIFSILLTLPYGVYMELKDFQEYYVCEENWPNDDSRKIFGSITTIIQFILPFFIIAYCYVCVSLRLNVRAKIRRGINARKDEVDRERKRRTNRMLIAMVTIFVISWSPLNFINILNDFYEQSICWPFIHVLFFMGHSIAMSSTCYNPFLYAWLNENFRKEFKQVIPCFHYLLPSSRKHHHGYGRKNLFNEFTRNGSRRLTENRTMNGTETVQESLLNSNNLLTDLTAYGENNSPKKQLQPREPIAEPIIHSKQSIHGYQLHPPTNPATLAENRNEVAISMSGLNDKVQDNK